MAYRVNGGPLWQLLQSFADSMMIECRQWIANGWDFPNIEKDWGQSDWYYYEETYGFRATYNDASEIGQQSSRHYHEHADNYFIMISGTIAVSVADNDIEFLSDGDVFCVPHGQHHHFTVVEPAVFVEIYLSPIGKPLADVDIVRLN